ncbi:MAG TPA: hotdog fold thioesterase [Rhodanobacteraceae bacterium]|nr:hotdog fold thioesterase [Rhodanobacteraceae bacterium]
MAIWKQQADLATVNAWSTGTLMQAIGIRITEIGDDFLAGTMPVDERTRQPYGILHGGASVALAETLGSTAAMLCCEEGTAAVGLDINANHLRAVREGTVTGVARPVHIGRSTQVWEIRIANEAGNPTCISRLTMAVVPQRAVAPKTAQGGHRPPRGAPG